jgi:RES domain-containing protein
MELFRVTRQPDPALAFNGFSSARSPGRWNERGRRAVYLSTRISLAILEVMVQAGTASLDGYVVFPVDIPDTLLTRFDRRRLSPTWRTVVGRDECRAFGQEWRARKVSLGLTVPSAVLPEAYPFGDVNVVVDPEHVDADKMAIRASMRFEVDRRLARLLGVSLAPTPSPKAPPARRPK